MRSTIKLFVLISVVVVIYVFIREEATQLEIPNYVSSKAPAAKLSNKISEHIILRNEKSIVAEINGRRMVVRDFVASDGRHPYVRLESLIPDFKNPCWYEDLNDSQPYKNNTFGNADIAWLYIDAKNSFSRMTRRWRQRFAKVAKEKVPLPRIRRVRCMPYFYIIGMHKCGTSDVYEKLTKHPHVTWVLKEPHWWSRMRFGAMHPISLSVKPVTFREYIDIYDEVADDISQRGFQTTIFGDASASTLADNDGWFYFQKWNSEWNASLDVDTTAAQIHHLNPKAKIIIMLRDPVDRLFSDYLYFKLNYNNPNVDDFHRRVVESIAVLQNCTSDASLARCARTPLKSPLPLHFGIYYIFVHDWIRIFGDDQVFVMRLEDYSVNRAAAINVIYNFLEVEKVNKDVDDDKQSIYNRGAVNIGAMRNDTRRILKRFYHSHNRHLARLLGDQRFLWK